MDCTEFIARFSEYYDGRVGPEADGPMAAHVETCVSCRRYHRVVTEGGQLLRSLPRPAVPPDFRPRLQHRIYHVEDEAALSRSSASGTTGATALGMALLLTLVAWSPTITDGPQDPDNAVAAPEATGMPATVQDRPTFFPLATSTLTQPPPPRHQGLWTIKHSHSLLYEYSVLSANRNRDGTQLRQIGLE